MARNPRGVVRVSLADQVTEEVRQMILVGECLPGQHITHEEMSNRLGVSTMPVREALLRLSHEGFIVARPGRHFEVASTTRDDINDIYWAHALVAGELTARAARNQDEEFVQGLALVQDQWKKLPRSATGELERLNHEFHRLINRQARSPKLIHILRNTIRLIPEHFYALVPSWREVSTTGHRAISDAIRERDSEAARRAAEAHVQDAGSLLAELFTDKGYWTDPGVRSAPPARASASARRRAPARP